MSVGLVEKEDIDLRVRGQGENGEPLQKTAPLDHEITLVVARMALELVALNSSFDHLHLDIGVVLLTKRSHVELRAKRQAQILLKQLPRVGLPKSGQVWITDLRLFTAESFPLRQVALLHIEKDVP